MLLIRLTGFVYSGFSSVSFCDINYIEHLRVIVLKFISMWYINFTGRGGGAVVDTTRKNAREIPKQMSTKLSFQHLNTYVLLQLFFFADRLSFFTGDSLFPHPCLGHNSSSDGHGGGSCRAFDCVWDGGGGPVV